MDYHHTQYAGIRNSSFMSTGEYKELLFNIMGILKSDKFT